MAIHPDSRFPLLPRDQADVIRIYLELKRAEDRSGREPEIAWYRPQQIGRTQRPGQFPQPGGHPAASWIPGDLTDRE